MRFGKKSQKRQTTPDTITFHLLHLSIMREYLDFEFASLKVGMGLIVYVSVCYYDQDILFHFTQDKLSFGYDLERIIDDWVLMGFLVGNDFLPHLPNMHIRQVCPSLPVFQIPWGIYAIPPFYSLHSRPDYGPCIVMFMYAFSFVS